MNRKRQPGSSNQSTSDSLRARLNKTVYKSPSRTPLNSIQQPKASQSSNHQSGGQKQGFSFEDENDVPPDNSSINYNQNDTNQRNRREYFDTDVITEMNDAEAEANEEDPSLVSAARKFLRTQVLTRAPREDTEGRVADGYDRPIYKRFKKLGAAVHTNDNRDIYFYIGELTHVKLLKLIESKWDDDEFVKRIMIELKDELNTNQESWKLFLLQSKNVNGTQDTIFRALILSKHSQAAAFELLFDKLNIIATKKSNEEQLKLGQDIIYQLRYITQVFFPAVIFEKVFGKKIETWTPILRDNLIEMLPELFTDSSVHPNAAKNLLPFLKNWSLDSHKTLQVAWLNAIKCFDIVNTNIGNIIYEILMKNLMNFEVENLPLVIDTALAVSKKLETDVFKNFLFRLCKYLNIEEFKKMEEQNESIKNVDKHISEVFFRITEFMRFNVSRSEKELLNFYSINKIIRERSSKLMKEQKRNVKNDKDFDGSDADEEEDEEEEETDDDDDDDDEENPNDPDFVLEKNETSSDDNEREFELIDVMLLICFNEACNDSSFALKELRKQVSISYDYFVNLKERFREVLEWFPTFAQTYLRSIRVLARDLVQSPNPQINEFGVVIYKYLFYNPRVDRITVLKSILSHLSEVDSETTVALSTLNEIVEDKLEFLKEFMSEMNSLTDNLSFLSTENIRKLFYILISLNFSPETLRPTQAQLVQKKEGDKFINRLNHYLTSNIFREVIWGVIGLIQYVKVILLKDRNGDNNEKISTILNRVNEIVKNGRGKVRAEFYIQLSELLKPMKKLGECEALLHRMLNKMFITVSESNVNLNSISSVTDSTAENDKIRTCNVLYAAIEYIRTVLNMFADCLCEKEKVHSWMDKKLKLMIFCQSQLNRKIENLGIYTLPRITQINKDQLLVKGKKESKKKNPSKKKKDADVSMEIDKSRDATFVFDNSDETNESHSSNNASAHPFKAFELRKEEILKKISLDQLQWYCTPLRLETVTTLLQLNGQTRKHFVFLVETLHVILKHTMPIRGKQMPAGFSIGSVAPIPIATMDFGTKEHRWRHVSAVIPSLIELLSRSVTHFQSDRTQTDPNTDYSALLKFCVMIFSRIFQSREIAIECDHYDSDRTTNLLSRREAIVSSFNRIIYLLNSSNVPQGDVTHNPYISSSLMSQEDDEILDISNTAGYLHGRVSDNGRESLENNTNEANVIEFFIQTAKYVSTIECASAMLALLKTFDKMDEHQKRSCALTALHYLKKTWPDEDVPEALEERNALLIATDFIYFRPDEQKLTAINWLIWHQFLSLYPNSIVSGSGLVVGKYKDSEKFVNDFEGEIFPCFEKVPQWHKLLFKQFNDNIFLHLKVKGKIDPRMQNTQQFLKQWKIQIESFYVLVFVLNNPGFRVHNVLFTSIKEGKRFISFILSKQSSFSLFIRSKEVMANSYESIVEILKTLQSANELLYDLQAYVKDKKNLALLKLIPELKAAQEKMAREFYDASAQGGFNQTIKFDFSKAKHFAEEDKIEKKTKKPKGEKAAKKPKSDKPPGPKKSKAAANGGGKKRPTKSTDEPAKKRARKSKDTISILESNADASYLSIAHGLGGVDSTRNISGFVDSSQDDDESRMSD
uniref:Uncharacterized protein n=1 Tax=Panagrolaimus superbus TaxID=310955 RepID=A0A914Z085_9BILA